MTPAEHSLVNTLTTFFCREGYPNHEDNPEVHRIHIDWEWRSGQWVMLTDKVTNRLLGWQSFYLVEESTLNLFDTGEYEDYIRDGKLVDLINGEHIYIATTVVMPWAPEGTYRRLFELVQMGNPKAKSINAHLLKRDGKIRRLNRTIN